uniref:TauD domain-containing protein n=1 Tax=Rhabditophanes sp. KR3021 TaxID=114890 RepID=A0AC35U4E2_9BILA
MQNSRLINCCRPICSIENNLGRRLVKVNFRKDKKIGLYPYVWLRDCSHDPKTYTISPAMTARNLAMKTFDVNVEPEKVWVDEEANALKIKWPGNLTSTYCSDWLKMRNLNDQVQREWRKSVYLENTKPWNKEEIANRQIRFDHTDVMTNDKTLHDFLETVCYDGIAILTNGPKNDNKVAEKLSDRFGFLHRTHFGNVFEVAVKMDASNMAYASDSELPFHTDFTSLQFPPQLQMLHMLHRAKEGGLSLFVDGFNIANIMKAEYPDHYNILTKYQMEFIEEGYDVHEINGKKDNKFDYNMMARHRIIQEDQNGKVVKIQFGNAMRSFFYDVTDVEEVQKIYNAMKLFTQLCYDDRNIFDIQLESGDTVLWANTRLLHTRTAFTSYPEIPRTIIGCYYEWNIIKSKVRMLRNKLKLGKAQPVI